MRIAVTGGTGFIGRHLARRLILEGHKVVLLARRKDAGSDVDSPENMTFVASDLSDQKVLLHAFSGCDAVAHCAGINREIGNQTYRKVHIEGTQNVLSAAKQAGVSKIGLISFLRARPNCGSPYHESKWAAEEIVRTWGLDYTIVRAGMVYGRGDHMLDHLSHSLHPFPMFATVGLEEKLIRPLPIEDLVEILQASFLKGRLSHLTVAVTGA